MKKIPYYRVNPKNERACWCPAASFTTAKNKPARQSRIDSNCQSQSAAGNRS